MYIGTCTLSCVAFTATENAIFASVNDVKAFGRSVQLFQA
jgi:hypothetical protein